VVFDDGGADEGDGVAVDILVMALELAAVGVALHRDGQEVEGFLLWVFDGLSHEDRAGANSPDGLLGELVCEGVPEVEAFDQFEHGGAFTAGDDEGIDFVELIGSFDSAEFCARGFDMSAVGFDGTLEGEDAYCGFSCHGVIFTTMITIDTTKCCKKIRFLVRLCGDDFSCWIGIFFNRFGRWREL